MAEMDDQAKNLVGIEVSISRFNCVCLDPQGNIVATLKEDIDHLEATMPALLRFVDSLRSKFGNFSDVGIAIPGLIHGDTKRVEYSAHIPEHVRIDLANELKAASGLNVTIENDANAAAYGEFRLGAGRESGNLFYATLGTGVGGAFILDGKIWRGASGFAGEFGYVAINSDGMRLEDVASAANVVRRTRNRFHQDSTSSLNRLDENQIRISDIVSAADKGDDFARMMLQRTGAYVGTAIASVINLLNIELIVIGGEIMRADGIVLDSIVERARDLSFGPSFRTTRITAGHLGENAAAIGVALLSGVSQTSE